MRVNVMKYAVGGCAVIAAIVAMALGGSIVETVEKGTYHIKQAAISGEMSAIMEPGMYMQNFGDIQTWPKASTFYFTADVGEGGSFDQSIEVRFNDGSLSNISGTMRIMMPSAPSQALDLVLKQGYMNFNDMENKLILPVVRNALRLTANLMSARESYAERRADFINWAWDQIQNGLYETKEERKKVEDLVSGEEITKTFKVIRRDKSGRPIYQRNPLEGLGLVLANFEVKSFVYSDKVKEQIATQQEAYMAVATAKAKSQQAEQDKLKIEAEGKAAVAKARYEEEQKKKRAVVQAEKDKEVALLQAQKVKEVAKLEKEAAMHTKQKEILLGQGEAERKKLVMQADGALKQKLDAYVSVMHKFAQEFGKQKWTPEIVFANGGKDGPAGNSVAEFMNLLSAQAARNLQLDLAVKKQ